MSSYVLPPIPECLLGLKPVMVGNAARLGRGGGPVHVLPELMIAKADDHILERVPELALDLHVPGSLIGHGWRIWSAPDGLEDALIARGIPEDAFAVDLAGGIIDPLGGVEGLQSGSIKIPDAALADPKISLRAVALAGESKLNLEPGALEKLSACTAQVFHAPRDLVRYWLTRLLVGRTPFDSLGTLREIGLLGYLLPEVDAFVNFHRTSRHHHKDVWEHTRLVVQQALPRPILRWSALLHDIGKVPTRSFTEKGKVHFLRHDDVGAYMFEGIAARLNFPEPMAERIRLLILHHLRPAMYNPDWTDAAVRRFSSRMGPIMDDLLDLARADVTSKRRATRRRAINNVLQLRERITALALSDESKRPRIPRGLGSAIIEQLGLPPGPQIGELRDRCEEALRSGQIGEGAPIEVFIEFLRSELAA